MLSNIQLSVLKEKYGIDKLIYLLFDGKEFVFKPLGINEYNSILKCVQNQKDLEDAVCQVALIYPEDYIFSESPYAGLPTLAYDTILKQSGVGDLDVIMDRMIEQKALMNRFDNQCINLVKSVFSEYTIEEITEWSWQKLIDMAVRAESILRIKGINVSLEDIRYLNNEEEEEEEQLTETQKIINEGKELRAYGIDPILYHIDKFIKNEKEILDTPFVGGLHWQRDDVINGIREQMEKQK